MTSFTVTKEVEFDTAHRVPNHKSKCRNLHGHRYRVLATIEGPVVAEEGDSAEGMVLDFGDIKKALMEQIHDKLDHGTLVYYKDQDMHDALGLPNFEDTFEDVPVYHIESAKNPFNWNVWVSNFVPTAENLAKWIFEVLGEKIDIPDAGVKVLYVQVFETPTSVARYPG